MFNTSLSKHTHACTVFSYHTIHSKSTTTVYCTELSLNGSENVNIPKVSLTYWRLVTMVVTSLIKPFNYIKASSNGCNNEHSSHHLLLASEPLKMQWITFVCEIIRDLASPTEEVSIRLFYSFLQITFPNNVRVMRMTGHPTEERGGVSRAH